MIAKDKPVDDDTGDHLATQGTKPNKKEEEVTKPEIVENFRPWMLAQRRSRRSIRNQEGKPMESKDQEKRKDNPPLGRKEYGGNLLRFTTLESLEQEDSLIGGDTDMEEDNVDREPQAIPSQAKPSNVRSKRLNVQIVEQLGTQQLEGTLTLGGVDHASQETLPKTRLHASKSTKGTNMQIRGQ